MATDLVALRVHLTMLRQAIEEHDPLPELILRLKDIIADIDREIDATPRPEKVG